VLLQLLLCGCQTDYILSGCLQVWILPARGGQKNAIL